MINGIPFEELFLLHSSIVVLALLLVKITKLPLGKFSALYAVMVAINVVIHQIIHPGEFLISTIVIGVIGFVFTVVLSGLIGSGMNSLNYSSIMVFVGLSPWYLGWKASLLMFVTILVLAIYLFARQTWAFKSVGHKRYVSMEQAKKKMKAEEFELFLTRANSIFAIPMIVGILLSMLLLGA